MKESPETRAQGTDPALPLRLRPVPVLRAFIKNDASEKQQKHGGELADFTTSLRVVPITALAVLIGLSSTGLAWLLLKLIGLGTNLFYYQRWATNMISPAANHLGWLSVFVPVVGALIVGLMARYGSDKIRGHGIPEAMESILMNGSRVQPKLAVLKPVSAAIAIGSGGPFGAEGPIIMTGGAVGSIIAQLFHLTSAERKTLLVAGASAGMAAVFAAPLSAMLLAIELLLFELKPRSVVPVALASVTAGFARVFVLGAGPLFPTAPDAGQFSTTTLLACLLSGLLAGLLAMVLSKSIYAVEDWFSQLPIHWMWWPAIGGIVVGAGGLIFPRALGVGYDVIGQFIKGDGPVTLFIGILLVKSIIWIASLGSGTSGGVLAPILMIGGALGGLEGLIFPHNGAGFWPIVGMGAVLAGALEAPFTAVVFSLELTRDFNMAIPLSMACFVAYGLMVLTMKRSILTEKIARRGYHLSREYAVDPLEIFLVKEAMRTNISAFPLSVRAEEAEQILLRTRRSKQHLYPVVDQQRNLVGVLTRKRLEHLLDEGGLRPEAVLEQAMTLNPVTARPDEPLRTVVYRMVETGFTRFPVVEQDGTLVGIVALEDLLSARVRALGEERDRDRPLRLRLFAGDSGAANGKAAVGASS
jgi:chloride channel protein, CIC family